MHTLLLLLLFFAVVACSNNANIHSTGAVSTAHPIATEIGENILQQGGNAFDAAIAVQYALSVVYPRAGNIGGGGFMVCRTADGRHYTLDFREKAPNLAHRDLYLDSLGNVMPNKSLLGALAAGVPGSVAGMDAIFERFATLPFTELISPAIEVAQNGVVLTEAEANKLNDYQTEFKEVNRFDIPVFNKNLWQKGDTVFYADLAESLDRIRSNGKKGFYEGKTAELIQQEMQAQGGIISLTDLKQYQAQWRAPVLSNYRGYTVISMPPPSSGGVALVQLLEGAEGFDFSQIPHNSTQAVHLQTELMRRVYADRATHLGDADFYDVPTAMLTDSLYISKRMADISPTKKTDSQTVKAGKVNRIESFETTHFSVVDKWGNAVAITTTLNGNYGSKLMVKGAGFFLNNEMDDFSVKVGHPNQFGLVGAEANAIAPNKRMLSSMTPTIVEKGDEFFVLGTPGGSTIITMVFQTILNVVDYQMPLQDAINATKIHAQWLPDRIVVEEGKLPSTTQKELQEMGHEIRTTSILGRMNCIHKKASGQLIAAADTLRSEGAAVAF